ncbi:protein cordon-bleu [Neosynchiropus ocellatus]
MSDFSSHSLGRRMKARAPPPPQQAPQPSPRRMPRSSTPEDGGTPGVDTKENILRQTVDLQLTLPRGARASHTADGRKALMDLLVELCSRFHLNPALHTLELYTPEGHSVGFKPNLLLGSLDVTSALIKEKVLEEKVARRPAPKVPEKTVRLMVNYHGNQKAVVRVNPLSPLQDLIPVIADKCDFNPAHVLLLRDSVSHRELPLNQSLTQLGIKEVYVLDQSLALQPKMASAPVLNYADSTYSSSASLSRAEKKGFLGLFQTRRPSRREASNTVETMDLDRCTDTHSNGTYSVTGVSPSNLSPHKMSPKSDPKKRRAPAPPASVAPSMEESHIRSHQVGYVSETMQRKRKAPAPPTPASITRGLDESPAAPDPTQSKTLHAKMAPTSTTVKTKAEWSVSADIPNSSSPTPSSSTVDSLAVQDSSSEFSHSLDDSDLDPDQTGSQLSSLTSSTASGSVRTVSRSSIVKVTEERGPAEASGGFPESGRESALNLKLEDAESNRHSTMDFVHTFKRSTEDHQAVDQEDETASVSSSGGSSSLIDHGYAASDGIAEDSGLVCSPYDTQPTSPEGSVFVHGNTGLQKSLHDTSSDSDEGCATWESRNRHGDLKPHSKSRGLTEQDEKTLDITWRFHHFETPPADNMAPVEQTRVPVSVVDMDVPVTAIDEVLEEFEVKREATVTQRVESFDHKGGKPDAEVRNKNNNAWTEADSRKAAASSERFREEKKKTKDKTLKETKDTRLRVEKEKPAEKVPPVYQVNSLPKHSKITHNVSSRFGMKTFTVVPPKPTVIQTSHDQAASVSPGAIKIDEQGNMVRAGTSWNKTSGSSSEFRKSERSPRVSSAKEFWSSSERQESVSPVRRDKFEISRRADATSSEWRTLKNEEKTGTLKKEEEVEFKIATPKVIPQPSHKASLPPPVQTNSLNRDLSFLKPSRRTSSHYVASAITKHRPNPGASTLEAPVPSRAGQSEQQNLQVSRHRSTDSVDARQLHREEKAVERRPSPLRVPTQNSNLDVRRHQTRSPSPSPHRQPQSKPLPAPKPASNVVAASAKITPKPERLVIPLGGDEETPAASIFGPVKKFKPVVFKSVEKESSLHSDLMEAIQNSGGKDRLKKVSSPGASGAKKVSYVEEENERSALLAAIRAQNNPGRLKKTQSAAAHELKVIRESVSEEPRSPKASPSASIITSPVLTSPPPPPPMLGPPPPLLLKPSAVSRPSPNDPSDPAAAREAMLEAIRSGSAAERLRKVSAPAKTIKVNGRRGTMQAAASALSRM